MKFQKYGESKQNLTEKMNPLEKAEEFVFARLDCLLSYIQENIPEIQQEYIEKLIKKLGMLIKQDNFENKTVEIATLTKDYNHLLNQQELVKLHLSFYTQILGISGDQFWEKGKIMEFPITNFIHSAFRLTYNQFLTLKGIIGKKEAIRHFKRHIDRYVLFWDTPRMEGWENLENMREDFIKFAESERFGRIWIISDIENGKFINRCDRCEKIESISDLGIEDNEVINALVCHSDFQVTKLYNENFVLTRNFTIGAGDSYCDFVYHDTRIDKDLDHPSKEFIESMWLLNETLTKKK